MSINRESSMIHVDNLSHAYGKTLAVDGLCLDVAPGEVLGLLGHNGAGKTTTILSLLGLLRPKSGSTSVFGLDSRKHGVTIRQRTGYVPENLRSYDWMTVAETLWFVSQFHPTWDAALQADLVRRLELPLEKKMNELSRGTQAKVALACATSFRPDALILDDPTSGLDAIVRREFLEHVIEVAAEGGRAVLFSSHVLDEVERLSDRVAIIVSGRKILDRRVDDLKASLQRVTLTFAGEPPADALAGAMGITRAGRVVSGVVDGWTEGMRAQLSNEGVGVEVAALSLEDAFVEVVMAAKGAAASKGLAR